MTKRIAIISDIHGNLPALDAVLADLDDQSPCEIIVGGDLVGRGPEGSGVIDRIRERGWPCVRGNHEDYLLAFRRGDVPEPWLHTKEWSASRWMAAELSDDDVAYIQELPDSVAPRLDRELLVVHGSPRSNVDGLGPLTSDSSLERRLAEIDPDVLICAHTHRPMERRVATGLVANIGAVGPPFNHDQRAQYAIVHHDPRRPGLDGWRIEFRQVAYDIEQTLERYETTGFAEAGGVTADLLRMELRHAAPFLVPFMKWAEVFQRPAEPSQIDDFLGFYDARAPMKEFMLRLQAAADGS